MELTANLPARQEAPTRRLLGADRALVHDLARAVGGPFHVVFPEQFAAATGEFR
ncbi:MAG: Y4yA family PLP-dependent enzyme, partial [Actinobacteria bacterium]|nr:Y4yA family PLP-dependent enzyme [Actinomycetota bacterium]